MHTSHLYQNTGLHRHWFPKSDDTRLRSHAAFRHTVGRIDAIAKVLLYTGTALFQTGKMALKLGAVIITADQFQRIVGPGWTFTGLAKDGSMLLHLIKQILKSGKHILTAPNINSLHAGETAKNLFTTYVYGADTDQSRAKRVGYHGLDMGTLRNFRRNGEEAFSVNNYFESGLQYGHCNHPCKARDYILLDLNVGDFICV